jgi:GT2 family glycosyltransferase
MITIIYSTHKDKEYNDKFNDHLVLTSGLQRVQILSYVNHNEYSLSELYNKGIKESKYDIVVCCHNDIKLEKNWGKKLLEDFNNNPNYGIIGKAGSCYFPESGVYWEKLHQTMVGQVYHYPPGQKKFLSRYSPKLPFLVPVVTIDGLFISFDKTKIKHTFDETIGKFHFYDHGFCIPNYLDGIKIGVTSSFEITHESVGQPNQEFWESKNKFIEKYKDNLPLDLKPEKIYVPEIKKKDFKKYGKVGVIIPTKGKVKMLFECVNSFMKHCDPTKFHIFIADTGSSSDEISWIKDNILNDNVTLIEYDYYNFAKINNDVVKNYVPTKYEFILFCNNDIKLLNDVITGMLLTHEKYKNCGTVGARLHYEDNTIQHDGIAAIYKNNILGLNHYNVRNYFNFNKDERITFGNTGGLLMIRKSLFERCGYFNENYISCFEDVELNMKCLIMGLDNYCDSSLVAYHYESQTRKNAGRNEGEKNDYIKILLPFINKNIKSLVNKIKFVRR